MTADIRSLGYRALPDLVAAMQSGPRGVAFVDHGNNDSDADTAQTVRHMCALIQESVEDPLTHKVAIEAVGSFARDNYADPRACAAACWWAVKHMLRFTLDQPMTHAIFGAPEALEFLVSPAVMLRTQKMQGDCDDFTMMICALLQCLGIDWEIVTVAANRREPGVYSHVYPRAVFADGSRLPLDASHGKFPGWQVPKAHVSRIAVWNEAGKQIEDQGSYWNGLHGYEWNRGMSGWGLGQDDSSDDSAEGEDLSGGGGSFNANTEDTGTFVSGGSDLSSGTTCAPGLVTYDGVTCVTPCPAGYSMASGVCVPGSTSGSASVPSGTNTLDSSLASILTQAFKTTGQIVAPQATITLPNGQTITGPASLFAAGQPLNTILSSSSLTSVVLIGGGLALILLFMAMAKK